MPATPPVSVTSDLATFVQALDDGIVVIDGSTKHPVYANEAGARLAGFRSPEELVAADGRWRDRMHIFDEQGASISADRMPSWNAAAGKRPPRTQVRIRATPSSISQERRGVVTTVPLLDGDGEVRQVVSVFRDNTEQHRATQALRFLAQASAALSASLDYTTTLQSLVSLVVPALADGCTVDVLDNDGLPHRVMAHADPARDELMREMRRRYPMRMDAPNGPALVMRTGQSALQHTLPDDELREMMHDEEHLRLFKALGYRETLFVPLSARGRVLGVLSLMMIEPGRDFGEDDVALAKELAARAAQAVDNAWLYREAQDSARRKEEESRTSEALRRIGASMASELNPGRLVQIITDEATAMVGAHHGAFFQNTSGPSGASHRLFAFSGPAREAFARLPLPGGTPLLDATFRGEGPIRCDDVREEPRYGQAGPLHGMSPGHPEVTSYLAVPVVSRSGEVLGALLFGHPERGAFTERHERLAVALATQATIALENARLFQRALAAEASSRESEERLRMALDAGRMGYFDLELSTGKAIVSPAVEAQLGFAPGQFGGDLPSFLARVHPGDRPAVTERLEQTTRSGTSLVLQYRVVRPDHSVSWIEAHTHVLRDGEGRPLRRVGVMLDMTERREAEEQARRLAVEHAARTQAEAAEARIEAILEGIGEPVFALDPEGRVHFLNRPAEALTGVPRAEVLGRRLLEVFPMQEARVLFERWQRELGTNPMLELEHEQSDGRWMELRARVFDGGQSLFLRDITARKREQEAEARRARQEALRADISTILGSREPLPATLRQCAEAMARHLDVVWASVWLLNAESQMLERQAVATTLANGFPSDNVALHTSEMERLLRERRPYVTNELLRSDRFSSKEWALANGLNALAGYPLAVGEMGIGVMVLLSRRPFPEHKQPVLAAIADAIAQGIERKRAEESLAQRAAELARSNAELEQFAYVASHDLKEPLRMVASYTQLLSRRYKGRLDSDADEFIQFAVDGAKRMQLLIADLLTYSRVGAQAKEHVPLRAGDVVGRALDNLQAAIAENTAEVVVGPLPEVMGDEVQLEQLFQNLAGNALKFHGESPPRVEISAEPRGAEWVFSVKDNGIGIEPQYFERIFVIFQRLHDKGQYPGTGIGLAVCKKIVERHGGQIWVESTPGQGTTFRFTLPAVAPGTGRT